MSPHWSMMVSLRRAVVQTMRDAFAESSRHREGSMTSTFVSIPADRLLPHLEEIGAKIAASGGRFERVTKGAETVFEIALPPSVRRSEFILIKAYTSIAQGADTARECGEDAIRIVVGSISTGDFKPVGPSTIVKRTAPNSVEDRVGAFLERLTSTLRKAYLFGRSVPLCECGHHMAERSTGGVDGKPYREFWGCTTYPICRKTKNI